LFSNWRTGGLIERGRQSLAEFQARAAIRIMQIGALEAYAHLLGEPSACVVVNQLGFELRQLLEGPRVNKVTLFQPRLLCFGELPEQVARHHLVRVSHRLVWV